MVNILNPNNKFNPYIETNPELRRIERSLAQAQEALERANEYGTLSDALLATERVSALNIQRDKVKQGYAPQEARRYLQAHNRRTKPARPIQPEPRSNVSYLRPISADRRVGR